jgi:hypothetical protein
MKKLIFLIFLLLLTRCNNKTLPQKSFNTDCDDTQDILATIKEQIKVDTCQDSSYIDFCNQMVESNLQLIDKVSSLNKTVSLQKREIDSLGKVKPTTYIDKSRTKTKTKNSNNTLEVTKLKNAIQIKDSQLDSVSFENLALNGKVKDLEKENTRLKNSTTGENSPNTNKSGNTTKKASWYLWLIVFVAGGITSLGTRAIITKTI